MAVLNRKPYRIELLVQKDGYEDDNGDYHDGEEMWIPTDRCDAVPSSSVNEKAFEDGVVRRFSYVVYLGRFCHEYVIGDVVRLIASDGTSKDYDVKGFHRYQHQAKMYL